MEKLLADLVSIPGPCGYEHKVIQYLYDYVKPYVDEIRIDGVGNLICTKKGAFPGPHLIVSAHSDEVGFIVKKIEKNGLIRFEKLGGSDDRILLAQQVKISTDKGIIPGVIGTISAHMVKFENNQLVRKHSELYIDCGARDEAEAKEMGIQVGDPITWATPYTPAGPHRAYGHAFDDRCGCTMIATAFKNVDFSKVHGTLTGVFSVQEEVGLRGAEAAARTVDADVAIALDATAISDTPEAVMDHTTALGAGAGIKVMDFSLIASKTVWKRMQKIAEEQNIPYQLEIFTGIGTDGGALHKARKGTPTGVISIPNRYAHSCIEMLDLDDFRNCQRLFEAFIYDMKEDDDYGFLNN